VETPHFEIRMAHRGVMCYQCLFGLYQPVSLPGLLFMTGLAQKNHGRVGYGRQRLGWNYDHYVGRRNLTNGGGIPYPRPFGEDACYIPKGSSADSTMCCFTDGLPSCL